MFASYQNRWWIAVASFSGLIVTTGTITVFAFAVLLKPVTTELQLSRSLLASGVLVANLICGCATPLMGALADRWGSRTVLIPGVILAAATMVAFSFLQSSRVALFTLFALLGAAGAAQNTVPYARVISRWFDRERGLALGIAMAGVGFGVAIVPAVASILIDAHGWRAAYVGLGAMIVLFAFVPVLLFVREPVRGELPASDCCAQAPELPGMTAREALTGWLFWVIAAAYLLNVIATNGTLANVVAMLTDRGSSQGQAVVALSGAGLAMIAGRVVSGWCLDRFHGPTVAVYFQIIPAIGLLCLAISDRGVLPVVGTMMCGLGLGAHVGMLAFFAGRYFGLKAFGTIYGTLFGMFLVGTGIGPFIGGLSFDLWQSYRPALILFACALLGASIVLARLGPYRFDTRSIAPPPDLQTMATDYASPTDRKMLRSQIHSAQPAASL